MSVSSALRAAAASFALVVVAVLGVAMPAAAREQPTGESTPAAGSTVTEAPTAVTIDFTADIDPNGALGAVLDAAGTDWSDGSATVDGATLTIPLRSGVPDGAYTVQWKIVSSDSHTNDGTFAFTVDTAGVSAPAPTATPAATVAVAPSENASDAAATTDAADNTARVAPWFIGTVIVLALIGAVAAVIGRSRRTS